jgi:hypothetical protein
MNIDGADTMTCKIGKSALFAVNLAISASAIANDFSFTGTLAADDEVLLFDFTVDAPSIVTLRTYSYAGGVQASGNIVPPGGFDPILALFDSEGNFITYNDDGMSGTVPFDPNTGEAFDTALEIVLDAGDYTVSVMQYNNKAIKPTLADGFDQSGDPFFTSAYNCSNGQFCDASNVAPYNNRTNEWAFDVLNVESATLISPESEPKPEPEPGDGCMAVCDRSDKHRLGDHAKHRHISRCSQETHYHDHLDRYNRFEDYSRDHHRDNYDRHGRYNRSGDHDYHGRYRHYRQPRS